MVNIMIKPIRMNHLIDLPEAKKFLIALLFFSIFIWDLLCYFFCLLPALHTH